LEKTSNIAGLMAYIGQVIDNMAQHAPVTVNHRLASQGSLKTFKLLLVCF
jgi:hypothetical protein